MYLSEQGVMVGFDSYGIWFLFLENGYNNPMMYNCTIVQIKNRSYAIPTESDFGILIMGVCP